MYARVIALVIVLGSIAAPLAAQRPQTRDGFWISFGWGYGSAAYSCDSCTATGRAGALSGYLRMGGTMSPHVLLGGESNGWLHNDSAGGQVLRGSLTFSLYYYPAPERGHFLTAGVGFSSFANNQSPGFSGIGFGFVVGAGSDLRVARNLSITPAVRWWAGTPNPQAPGYGSPGGYFQNVLQVVAGLTFH